MAAGLVNTMQRVGSAVGLAVLTAAATARTWALAAPGVQVIAVVGGYDRAFAIAAGFAAAAGLLSLATARTRMPIADALLAPGAWPIPGTPPALEPGETSTDIKIEYLFGSRIRA